MSALTRPGPHSEDPSRFAPKWVREGRLRQPEPVSRLPRATQFGANEAPSDASVVSWPQERRYNDNPEPLPEREDSVFEGDLAIRQMREARTFEPHEHEAVSEPRWSPPSKFPLSMLLRTTVAIAVATIGALIYVGGVPLTMPAAVQDVVSSMRQTTDVGTVSRPPAVERPTKMAGRIGDEPVVGERPSAGATADPPAVAAREGARAVRTVAVSPWPGTATPQPTVAPAAPPPVAAAPAAPVVVAAAPPPAAPAAALVSPPAPAAAAVTRHLDRGEIDALIQRGEAFILQGDFSAARLMLQRAAEAGSDRAALTLGATYDPLMLRKVGVVGFKAEPALAREWYERAAALGSSEASSRLAELGRK